ncbi:hypothetical protein [Bacillus sp. ISL-46]|uniref:hypothetical protein n=1 Tax=Bacillus sp. ISL-46 TaxID=2819129 RepID=UPI001BECD770|nr:hypothetical protein [Bacillus sp. ISL-46]MBT2722784.1 hypothetical protein [Bacillus sp. ISL-46]
MIKITKGALAMVLAGSVTFSVANALLGDQPLKRLTKEMALPISADRKKADVINPAEKKDKPQTPAANVKDHDIAAIRDSLKNRNTNDTAVTAVQQNRGKSSDRTTTNPANPSETKTTTPVATSIPVKSTKAPTTTRKPTTTRTAATRSTTKPAAPTAPATSVKAPPTTTTPTATKTSTTTTKTNTTTSATTTKTNRGQQVSQAAKEKAVSRSDKKENNGKKM